MVKVIVPAGASPVLTWHAVSAACTVMGPAGASAPEAEPPDGAAGGAVLVQPARATAAPAVSSAATDLRDMVLLGKRRGWGQAALDVVGVVAGAFATAGRRGRRNSGRTTPT